MGLSTINIMCGWKQQAQGFQQGNFDSHQNVCFVLPTNTGFQSYFEPKEKVTIRLRKQKTTTTNDTGTLNSEPTGCSFSKIGSEAEIETILIR